MALNNIIPDRKINLPVIGAVSVVTLGIGALAFYFLVLRRKGRITSVTTRYRK